MKFSPKAETESSGFRGPEVPACGAGKGDSGGEGSGGEGISEGASGQSGPGFPPRIRSVRPPCARTESSLNMNRTPEKSSDFSGVSLYAVDFFTGFCYKFVGERRA